MALAAGGVMDLSGWSHHGADPAEMWPTVADPAGWSPAAVDPGSSPPSMDPMAGSIADPTDGATMARIQQRRGLQQQIRPPPLAPWLHRQWRSTTGK